MSKLWIAEITKKVVIFTEDDKEPNPWVVERYAAEEDSTADCFVSEASDLASLQAESGWKELFCLV